MTTKPKVTDGSWLSGPEWVGARCLRLAVLVAATVAVTASSPAQDGLYDLVPGAVSEEHGAAPAPDGVLPVTGADVRDDADSANDLNRDGEPPGPPTNPSPAHGATGIPRYTGLYWWPAPRADSYDVYFGTDDPPPYVGNTSYWCWWPGEVLELDTTYYWQIVAKNASGSTPGPVWWFHTTKHAVVCPGDMNCDDFVDFGDINLYVLAFANWPAWRQQYPDCPPENAYIEINAFATRLASGGGYPVPCLPPPGACRLAGACELKTEAECTTAGGAWQGAETVCAPSPDGEPPSEPSNPVPAHGATRVWIEVVLDWADATGAESYDVYFGAADPPPYAGNTPASYWLPNQLSYDTTYYWQVVAKNASGSTPGPVWGFRTIGVCVGDLNCDNFIDFGDINPYVLALSNWQAWLLKHPGCPPENGCIGINEFVALLISGGGQSIPCE